MFAIGLKITNKKNRYLIVQDRVVLDTDDVADDEFIFATINRLHFVIAYKAAEQANIIGYWHTIIGNNEFDDSFFIKILATKSTNGAYLKITDTVAEQGFIFQKQTLVTTNNIDIENATKVHFSLEKIKTIHAIVSPIKIKKQQQKRQKQAWIISVLFWCIIFIFIFILQLRVNAENSGQYNLIDEKENSITKLNKEIKKYHIISRKQSPFVKTHITTLSQVVLCSSDIQGEIDLNLTHARLQLINNKASNCIKNIKTVNINNTLSAVELSWGAK